jgi:hypothetical protein
MKIIKSIVKILIVLWSIFCLVGVIGNMSSYNLIAWLALIPIVAIPYIILFLILKKINSKIGPEDSTYEKKFTIKPNSKKEPKTTVQPETPVVNVDAPVESEMQKTSGKQHRSNTKKNNCFSTGCLTIIVFVVLFAGVGVVMSLTMNKVTDNSTATNGILKFIDIPDDAAQNIDSILAECGIEELSSAEHDELLDNAHIQGETGYRLTSKDASNIILYLNEDYSVNRIRYSDYDLYNDGSKLATLQDYVVSIDEVNKYQILCEDKVKEILKSPSTAKFPNYTEWGFRQEMNIFTIQGYVDAENSFGAEIRSKFQFIIDMDTNTIQSFIFDGEELIAN